MDCEDTFLDPVYPVCTTIASSCFKDKLLFIINMKMLLRKKHKKDTRN